MRKTFFAVLACLIPMLALAQDMKVLPAPAVFHEWSDGPLTMEDFTESHVGESDGPSAGSFLAMNIWEDYFQTRKGNTVFFPWKLKLISEPRNSWYDPDLAGENMLRYNQLKFDIAEVMRRKWQNALNGHDVLPETSDYYRRLTRGVIEQFEMETAYGRDTALMARYEAEYRQLLVDVREEEPVLLDSKKEGVGIGISLGYAFENNMDKVGEFYTPLHGIGAAARINYDRSWLVFQASLTFGGKIRGAGMFYDKDIDYLWRDSLNCRSDKIDVLIGYDLLDGKYATVAPFVGCGFAQMSQATGFEDKKKPANSFIYAGRLSYGLSFSGKWRRYLMPGNYSETNLNLKVYMAHNHFDTLGWSRSLNVVLCVDMPAWAPQVR